MKALIFDCDGVLADSERDGHLPAFNQAFAEFGVPVLWTEEEYGEKLRIGGGKERVLSALTPAVVRAAGLPEDPAGQRDWVARFHARKTAIFTELVRSGALPGRPGIARIVDAALAEGIAPAVASTSAEASVRAILEQTLGRDRASHFAVFAGDAVAAKKPDPAIYLLALEGLGVAATEALAIEDSENGLRAALAAGLACVVTISSYTGGEDFTGAALIVPNLGEPPDDCVTLADLRRLVG